MAMKIQVSNSSLTDTIEATASNNVTITATVFVDKTTSTLTKVEAGVAKEGETYLGGITYSHNNLANAEVDNKWQITAQAINISKIAVALSELELALKTKYNLL